MKIHRSWLLLLFVACFGCGCAAAAETPLDPARLIAESGSLQKKPEPEMSESERAVYEKVAPILARKPEFALKLLRAMTTSSDPDAKPSPAFDFMLGNAFYAAGKYPEAEVKYRSAVERNPTFIRAWNNLGVLYYVQERYAQAVPCFSRSVTLGERDATTFGLLGNTLEKTGNTVSAEMAYMQALAVDPANVSWTEGLLRIYLADKQSAKAEILVRTLLTNHPQDARYWQTYAQLLLFAGRKIEAIALLERMSATGLTRESDVILLGDLYAELRMTTETLATFGRVATAQPELAERRLLQFARALSGERSWPDAAMVLDRLAKSSLTPSGRIGYLETRADLAVTRQNWPEAKTAFEALVAEAPKQGNAWVGLGRIYLAEAEEAKAIGAFERAYEIPESSYRACIELTNIEFKHRHYERCLGFLEHALSIQRSPAVESFRNQVKNLVPQEKPLKS